MLDCVFNFQALFFSIKNMLTNKKIALVVIVYFYINSKYFKMRIRTKVFVGKHSYSS